MKVAVITANIAPRYGGPASAEQAYCQALGEAGAEVRLVTTDQDGAGRLSVPHDEPVIGDRSYETWYHPAGPGRRRPASAAWAQGIRRAVDWADVVRVNSLYLPHNAFVHRACVRARTPYVIRPHGTLEPYQRRNSRRLKRAYDLAFGTRYLRDAAGFHFTTAREAHHAADLIGTARSFVVPVPVAVPTNAAPVDRNTDVVFLGRVTAKKRLDLLLDSWPSVHRAHPEASLVIAGPVDPDRRDDIERARTLPATRVLGLLDKQGCDVVMANAAVFVLASENENFGVAVAEAMAHGVPVVVSDAVALTEEMAMHQAGRVLRRPTSSDLATAIVRLLATPDERLRIGRRGRDLAVDRLESRAIGNLLLNNLAHIVAMSRPRTSGLLAVEMNPSRLPI